MGKGRGRRESGAQLELAEIAAPDGEEAEATESVTPRAAPAETATPRIDTAPAGLSAGSADGGGGQEPKGSQPAVVPAAPPRRLTAVEMGHKQREISVSEFFKKNRHLLGFDNPQKALLTTIKEAVDNALDACEEAGILPDVLVEIHALEGEERFQVVVEDGGPGIVRNQVPNIFGKLLYGSKFHTLKMSRGQQGIGISAAGMYGQLTTGHPVRITSRIAPNKPAHYCELKIETGQNRPEILVDNTLSTWHRPNGTRVEIDLEARYQRGRQSVEDYLKQTAIANPHVEMVYRTPEGETITYPRASHELPREPKEIKPHPYGIELGAFGDMLKATSSRNLRGFLAGDFSRVSARLASEICEKAGVAPSLSPKKATAAQAEAIFKAIGATKIMAPPTDCIVPIGEPLVLDGLRKEIRADFYTATTRSPSVYRGNPFQVEAGLAYGGALAGDEPIRLLRYANRVPLLYQQSACAVTKSAISTDWRKYGLQQPKGALPVGPMVLLVHIASVWVPFTSESKEAIAHYEEIVREIRLVLQDCGRKLSHFLSHRRREADANKKRAYIEKYIPHIGDALRDILGLSEKDREKTVAVLADTLERSRKL